MIPTWIVVVVLIGLPLVYAFGIATGYKLATGRGLDLKRELKNRCEKEE